MFFRGVNLARMVVVIYMADLKDPGTVSMGKESTLMD